MKDVLWKLVELLQWPLVWAARLFQPEDFCPYCSREFQVTPRRRNASVLVYCLHCEIAFLRFEDDYKHYLFEPKLDFCKNLREVEELKPHAHELFRLRIQEIVVAQTQRWFNQLPLVGRHHFGIPLSDVEMEKLGLLRHGDPVPREVGRLYRPRYYHRDRFVRLEAIDEGSPPYKWPADPEQMYREDMKTVIAYLMGRERVPGEETATVAV